MLGRPALPRRWGGIRKVFLVHGLDMMGRVEVFGGRGKGVRKLSLFVEVGVKGEGQYGVGMALSGLLFHA